MTMLLPDEPPVLAALRLRVHGRVQGVGFRPFVYRLAHELGLSGWVQNRSGEVEIQIQGAPAILEAFQQALIQQAPPLARPQLGAVEPICLQDFNGFSIQPSTADEVPDVHVPPDCFTCDDCLAELRNPQARRYRYPFINCTQCGPRYTLIRALPYDRPHTTLAGFPCVRIALLNSTIRWTGAFMPSHWPVRFAVRRWSFIRATGSPVEQRHWQLALQPCKPVRSSP